MSFEISQDKLFTVEKPAVRIGRHVVLTAISCVLAAFLAGAAAATDLLTGLQAPIFGGSNGASLTAAQTGETLKQQARANAANNNKPPVVVDPNAAFVQAITSQLTGLVAETIASKIANSTNGQAGTIRSGGVVITYVNSDGELTVTIATPTGTSELTIPVAGGS